MTPVEVSEDGSDGAVFVVDNDDGSDDDDDGDGIVIVVTFGPLPFALLAIFSPICFSFFLYVLVSL